MNYLKFTFYLYIAATLFFLYSAYEGYKNGSDDPVFMLVLAGCCFLLFLFRYRFMKKREQWERDRNNKTDRS